ncbi:MAG: hypothetical protein WCP09_01635 [Candidatus Taylorbacteria bacterium]
MSLSFTKEALKKFKTQGSLFPSTSALGKMMIKPIVMKPGMIIVEFGAGTGSITKELIPRLRYGATFLVFENNKVLAEKLRDDLVPYIEATKSHSKVILIEDDAANLRAHLDRLGLPLADYVISGLPIGNFKRHERQKIFDAINEGMKEDGIYVQFQYLLASFLHVRRVFDAKVIGYEVRNVPPAFVYVCKKKAE